MRTTLNIHDHLLAEAKILAAKNHRSVGDVVNDALNFFFAKFGESDSNRPRQRVVLPTGGHGGLRPGVDLSDKEALAELLGDNDPPKC
ncbi:MAG: ribbon-helix-helix domain-containing protein [Candidatus Dormibacteraceae bacterium]